MNDFVKKVCLLALVFLSACFGDEDKYDYNKQFSETYFAYYLCSGGLNRAGDDVITYEDLQDGTIKKTLMTPLRENCRGESIRTQIIYFKKCLQGQVYRIAENDCQGTGSADDNWGAAKYQFCPTNDEACDLADESVADPVKSPAANACAEDTAAGKAWKLVADIYDALGEGDLFPENVLSIIPDMPTGDDERIWRESLSAVDSLTKARTYRFKPDGSLQSGVLLKDSYQYVLCVTEWEITIEAAK